MVSKDITMDAPDSNSSSLITNSSFISVRGLSCAYQSRPWGVFGKKEVKPVLDKVDLNINRGEIFGLVGESGCGKTTLGRCILGLIDYEGEIIINGARGLSRASSKKPALGDRKKAALEVQAVFQDSGSSLNPARAVGWILEEPLRAHGLPLVNGRSGSSAERQEKVDSVLELVGLDSSYKKRKPGELSSGQKQRIAIASALMLDPGLIVADEPVSALDVSVAAQILNLFRELNRRLGLTLLFISHNLDMVDYLCDRVAVMKNGKLINSEQLIINNEQ